MNTNSSAETGGGSVKIGTRVQFNDLVAFAYVGARGTVEAIKEDILEPGKILFVVRLDTPTSPAENWPAIETLAASSACMSQQPDTTAPAIQRSYHKWASRVRSEYATPGLESCEDIGHNWRCIGTSDDGDTFYTCRDCGEECEA